MFKNKIFSILFFVILIIFLVDFVSAEIVNINPDIAYPGDSIQLTINPKRQAGFYNIIYVYDSNDMVVDLINVPCDTICKERMIVFYVIPLDFLGEYYFATFDYSIDDYELDYFTIIEQGGAPAGELNIDGIRNFGQNLNFMINPEQGKRANVEITVTLKEKSCETYDVAVNICEPDLISLCDSETYTYQIPLTFASKKGSSCSFNYIGEDYFPFYETPGDWKIIAESGALYDENNFIYTELIAIDYASFIDFGTLNARMWNTGVPSGGLELSNAGNMPLTIDWQSSGFSCVSPLTCTDFWPTQSNAGNNFQIDDDDFFAELPADETGLNPVFIIGTPGNYFPETGLEICISDSCDDDIGEKTGTYYNLRLTDIERGVYQGDIIVTLS